ncbi:hypothetical protein J5289_27165 (plasmid) [Rhizobium sp. B230/85]|uniref:hypothetical protein n=1 Tax=Rhizobium sp. B230/85 TaxID=2819994 RepID=UPI001ADD4685|nr:MULTISPECIES: hypothetical protein [unclassified Rhizobium]MBO9134468.1 hypothetical protein [Rhizobium sp. B209b/85]QXZ99684.1 hypothetical protein J5289_27165 [Rhizobium sp. B230/85]
MNDLVSAIDDALQSVKEIVADCSASGKPVGGQQFEIVDETGSVWAVIQFRAFTPNLVPKHLNGSETVYRLPSQKNRALDAI